MGTPLKKIETNCAQVCVLGKRQPRLRSDGEPAVGVWEKSSRLVFWSVAECRTLRLAIFQDKASTQEGTRYAHSSWAGSGAPPPKPPLIWRKKQSKWKITVAWKSQ